MMKSTGIPQMRSDTDAPGVVVTSLDVEFDGKPLLSGFNEYFQGREITCMLGRSGVGKSTLLRIIAGIEHSSITKGEVRASDGGLLRPRIAWMGQSPELIPWLGVRENALLGARLRGEKPETALARDLLGEVGLGDYLESRVSSLSGGMKQRLALVRTVLLRRPIVLMDEPFSGLDAITRMEMQDLSIRLLRNRTVICVTHDPLEALRLGERLLILAGRPVRAKAIGLPDTPVPRSIAARETSQLYAEIMSSL